MKKVELEKIEGSKKSSHALAAANIRKELKANFPDVKFSVKSKSYSMGSSIDVCWVDGVTTAQVDAIIEKYQYAGVMDMDDHVPTKKGFDHSYGDAKYVFSNRSYSDEAKEWALEGMAPEHRGLMIEDLCDGDFIGYYSLDNASDQEYNKLLRERDFTKEETPQSKIVEQSRARMKQYKNLSVDEFSISVAEEPACITEARGVYQHLKEYKDKNQEHFIVITLDGASKIINTRVVFKGTINQSIVHPREVFADAVEDRAVGIIIAHNHPSGTLRASSADIQITKRLKQASVIMGIELLDHVIISKEGYYSFSDEGLL